MARKEAGNEVRSRNRSWVRKLDSMGGQGQARAKKKGKDRKRGGRGKARKTLGQAGQNQEGGGLVSLYGFQFPQANSDGGYILGGYSNSGISGDKTDSYWGNEDYWILGQSTETIR